MKQDVIKLIGLVSSRLLKMRKKFMKFKKKQTKQRASYQVSSSNKDILQSFFVSWAIYVHKAKDRYNPQA